MDTSDREKDRLYDIVASLDMDLLMSQNVGTFGILKA